jgi:hypothetical protein
LVELVVEHVSSARRKCNGPYSSASPRLLFGV